MSTAEMELNELRIRRMLRLGLLQRPRIVRFVWAGVSFAKGRCDGQ